MVQDDLKPSCLLLIWRWAQNMLQVHIKDSRNGIIGQSNNDTLADWSTKGDQKVL